MTLRCKLFSCKWQLTHTEKINNEWVAYGYCPRCLRSLSRPWHSLWSDTPEIR